MPRSPGQSDFVFEPNLRAEPVEDPYLASRRATRVVMTITWLVLAALVLLCAIGPHIPAGE